jgi:hypothetical protein
MNYLMGDLFLVFAIIARNLYGHRLHIAIYVMIKHYGKTQVGMEKF